VTTGQVEPATGKRVSWAELFFDLVFVFAVTQVSELLHHDHTLAGLGRAFIVFVPIYWVWVGTSIQSNVQDMTRPAGRLTIFAVALGGLFMALSVPHAFENWGLFFALSYWASRLVLGLRLFTGSNFTVNPFTVSMTVSGPLLVIGGLLDGPARLVLWAAVAAIDLATPTVLRARLRGMHFDAEHLTERFGLFVLIAIGESVVAIGTPVAKSSHLDWSTIAAVTAAFALSCGLWWVYFHFATAAMQHALETASIQVSITRHVLSYGHVGFIASIIALSVGMSEAVNEPKHALSPSILALLYGGCAVYLATFGYTRWMMFRKLSTTRLAAAACVLLLYPVDLHLPAIAAVTTLAAVLVILNAVEYRLADRPSS
jgi:low temperature requirement protein LtrA